MHSMGTRYGDRSSYEVRARPALSPGAWLVVLVLLVGAIVPATRTPALIALGVLGLVALASFLLQLSPLASVAVVALVVAAMVPATRAVALIAVGVLALVGVASVFLRLAETLGSERLAVATRALVALLPVAAVVWGGLTDGKWLWELVVILGLAWLGVEQLIDWGDPLGWRARRAYRSAAWDAAPPEASALPPAALREDGYVDAGAVPGREASASTAGEQGEATGTVVRAAGRRGVEEILADLERMPGLGRVAERVGELVDWVELDRRRRAVGLAGGELALHLVFLGAPGTGKTTVARLLGELYAALGLLERGHLIETDRSGLVGEYLGHSTRKAHDQIARAQGGVLFVDEAYALVDRERRDWFGDEAIAALVKRMEDDAGTWACVLAGHGDEMQRLLDSNAGLRSRVQTIEFPDYDADALMAIAASMLERRDYELGDGAREALAHGLRELHAQRERGWGNAREVRKLIDYAIRAQARRRREAGTAEEDTVELRTLRLADVTAALERRRSERPENGAEPPFDVSA